MHLKGTDTVNEQTFSIKLNAQRVEYLLNVLAQRPYIEVAALVEDLRAQLQQQAQSPEGSPQLKAV